MPDRKKSPYRKLGALLLFLGLLFSPGAFGREDPSETGEAPRAVRNVILMISDGAGFNCFDACSFFQYGELGKQVYDQFTVQIACTHFSLDKDGAPLGYEPNRMWKDYSYSISRATDSAAAATAMLSGKKTINGRINVDVEGNRLKTVAEHFAARGWSSGVVSTVPFSHATPAGAWAHHESRSDYEAIAREMIFESSLDLIMGAGHPLFDDNGRPVDPGTLTYKYVGGKDTWDSLARGTTGKGWTLLEQKEEFEEWAEVSDPVPCRVIGVPRAHSTLQYKRSGSGMGDLNPHVPSLATMTRAALNVLHRKGTGFFLLVEGGAVDWANHDNNLERMIEEQIDFNRAVEAAVQWVAGHGGWEQNLLIVTSDHECGMLWGPGTYLDQNENGAYDGEDAFLKWVPVENRGAGILPGVQYGSRDHSNTLVPLYAMGRGSRQFLQLVDGWDPGALILWRTAGWWVDNRDLFTVILPHGL